MDPSVESTVYDAPGWDALWSSPGWPMLLSALAVLAVATAVAYGWRERRLAPRGWGALLLLRLTAVAAAGLLLAGVERRPLTEVLRPSEVVLLVDRSASMSLPAQENGATPSRTKKAGPTVEAIAAELAKTHEVRRAGFDLGVRYKQDDDDAGSATRLGTAINRVLADRAAAPLAAVVVVSDGGWNGGPDPLESATAAAARETPLYTLGVGPLKRPPSVALREIAAPSRAATGDDFKVSVTLAANESAARGASPQRVKVSLHPLGPDDKPGDAATEVELELKPPEEGGLAAGTAEMEGLPAGRYEIAAALESPKLDANPADNHLTARIEFIDQPTRVLLAAGGPARDYHFLRDQLYRDELFTCDVLLQSATGPVTQDADKLLAALPANADEWEAYDVLIAIDVDWRLVDADTQQAIADWVGSRGGGLVFFAGPVATPGCVRAGLEEPLRALLPVNLRDDPLALGTMIGAVRDARPVRTTPAGESLPWLDQQAEVDGQATNVWESLEGFYAATLPGEVKPGATVLATLGESATAEPLLVEQLYGAGRIVYCASAELWRLRTIGTDVFTALEVGLMRHASQGRLLGAAVDGSLLFDRPRYDLGEVLGVRYIARSPLAAPPAVRLTAPDAAPVDLRLTPVDGQPGVYAATVRADQVGRHVATTVTDDGGRLSAVAEVSLPALENETYVQNAPLLRAVAERSGGRYFDLGDPAASDEVRQAIAAIPSLAETTVELGPPDEAFAERLSRLAMATMAGALLLEWLLRRLWRLA